MDIKEQINKLVDAVTKDESVKELFKKEPIKAVEKVIGVDLPDDIVEKIIDGVKGKISLDKLSGAADALKKIF